MPGASGHEVVETEAFSYILMRKTTERGEGGLMMTKQPVNDTEPRG